MSSTPLPAEWATPAYADLVRDWCASVLGPVGEMTQHRLRPWATVWRIGSASGPHYFKQNCPGQAFEAAAVDVLAELAPQHTVPVRAVDTERGFLLTPDQGPVFGDVAGDDLDSWCRLVATAARFQRAIAPSVDRLTAVGMTVMPVAGSAAYVEQRIADFSALPHSHPSHLPEEQVAALRGRLPAVRAWSEQVAALGLPLTLHHNDLHEHNAFDVDGELRFFDFGDALISEPLGELRIPLAVLAHRLGCDPTDPRLGPVVDAFLEVWSDVVPVAQLRAALPTAMHLAQLGRVESWVRCIATFTEPELAEYGDAPAYWLGTLLQEPAVL